MVAFLAVAHNRRRTAAEEDEHSHELEKTYRALPLEGVETEEAIGGRPSTGATPRPLQLLDLSSASTTTAVEGERN